MSDPGTRAADAAQKALERRMIAVYREAQEDIIKKLNAHTVRLNAMEKVKRMQLESGQITEKQYNEWLYGQMFTGKQWMDKVDSVAASLLYANQQANDMIEGKKRAVFGENATYQAYKLEKDAGMDLSFGIYDSATVTRLVKDEPELLPRKEVNGKKDKAWNRKKIANAVTQGVIQGEGIPDIAKRIAKQVSSENMKAMTRYARTAMTGAQNAGRMEMLHEAQDMGIKVKKKWLATLDKRTRDVHRELDGQVVDVDEPFHSSLGDIMYPGDPAAEPGNVYNCRCTLVYVYPEYMPQNAERRAYNEDRTESEVIPDMTYNEWKARKAGGVIPEKEEEPTLEDLFADLWNGTGTESKTGELKEALSVADALRKDAELEKPGRFGVKEAEYPKALQLSDYDEKRLEAIEHYWDNSYKMPKDMVPIKDDELRLAKGDESWYNADAIAADRRRQKERIEEDKAEIAAKKESGYKGMSKEQSAARWKSLKRELLEADEMERGSVLANARVGENGIQHWQRDKKQAERELQRLDFVDKLFKRLLFSRGE